MSHIAQNTETTARDASAPAIPTHLTSSAAAVYAALTTMDDDGLTAAEIALAAHVGRSTASKVLASLEREGLAVRTPGGHDGARRLADLWHPIHLPAHNGRSLGSGRTCGNAAADTSASATPQPPHNDTAPPEAPAEGTRLQESNTATPNADASDTEQTTAQNHDTHHTEQDGAQTAKPANALTTQPETRRPTAAAQTTQQRTKRRLAPGGLRQMVHEHLQNHPGQAFTATRISRLIDRSSGAIANALDKLTQQGLAELVSDQPGTYRLTASDVDIQ